MTLHQHIAESELREYAWGKCHSEEWIETIEQHLLMCESCRRVVERQDELPLNVSHSTSDGIVEVRVHSQAGQYVVRITGPELDSMAAEPSLAAANRNARNSFEQMFPEHFCTARCVIGARNQV